MTKLLQEAFERAQTLPDSVQDEIAAALIERMDTDFDELIESHPDVLDELVREALEDIRTGRGAALTDEDFAVEAD